MSFPGFVPDIAGPPFRRVAVFLGFGSSERFQDTRVFSTRARQPCRNMLRAAT
jgi:hypothetical protein